MASGNGRVVAGRYRLSHALGHGGMGAVWQAHDTLLGRDVAVKEIWFPSAADGPVDPADPLLRRALREAQAAARLRHPGIVTVHDVVMDSGRPWIVMELVEGQSLAQAIRAHGLLTAARTASIGLQVLDALRAAHREGIAHRDVKPANILLDIDRVVLTDFGIAAIDDATALTATGQMIGSPAYLAPERINGHPATAASDLWSLGVTLYAALTGKSPFQREDTQATFAAVLHSRPETPAHGGRLWPAVKGLLEKDPARRLTDAQARPLLLKAAEQAEPPAAPDRRPRWWAPRPRRPEPDTGTLPRTLNAPPPTLAAPTSHQPALAPPSSPAFEEPKAAATVPRAATPAAPPSETVPAETPTADTIPARAAADTVPAATPTADTAAAGAAAADTAVTGAAATDTVPAATPTADTVAAGTAAADTVRVATSAADTVAAGTPVEGLAAAAHRDTTVVGDGVPAYAASTAPAAVVTPPGGTAVAPAPAAGATIAPNAAAGTTRAGTDPVDSAVKAENADTVPDGRVAGSAVPAAATPPDLITVAPAEWPAPLTLPDETPVLGGTPVTPIPLAPMDTEPLPHTPPARKRADWLVPAAAVVVLLVGAGLTLRFLWPSADSDDDAGGLTGKKSAIGSSAPAAAPASASKSPSPTTPANPSLDSCLVGRWRMTSIQVINNFENQKSRFTGKGGVIMRIWPDGKEIDDYSKSAPLTATINGHKYVEWLRGTETLHTATKGGRVYGSDMSGGRTLRITRDGRTIQSKSIMTPSGSLPYICTETTLTTYGDDDVSTQSHVRLSHTP